MSHPEQQQKTILVMAGGTGGHVFPALAVARKLQQQGCRIEWLGTERGIESEVVVKANIPITYIGVAGLRGTGLIRKVQAPFKLLWALMQSLMAVLRIKPVCVLGMGGFASGPGGVAAWMLRRPLVIHEQNAVAGMTNRMLKPFANRVLAAFPGAFEEDRDVIAVGNPLRDTISRLSEASSAPGQGKLRLLVLGGSLGARVLNEVVPRAIALMPQAKRPEVWHQTGKHNEQVTAQAYQSEQLEARVDTFIHDMEQAYQWADVIVCRSGALTVSEIACVGLASILVPYPHAVDDHQTRNAGFLEQAGAAVIVPQSQFTADSLAQLLTNQFSERDRITDMSEKARAVAQKDAAERVAEYCLEVCHA